MIKNQTSLKIAFKAARDHELEQQPQSKKEIPSNSMM